MTARAGTVYLLHFDRRYRHAGHYIGWAVNLNARLAAHRRGHGARLLQVVHAAGIGWQLARTWPGSRDRERQIKTQGGASRCCPLCGVVPRTGDLPRNADGSLSRTRTTDTQKQHAGVMTSAQQAAHTALRPKPKDDRAGKQRARQADITQWLTPEPQSQPSTPVPAGRWN